MQDAFHFSVARDKIDRRNDLTIAESELSKIEDVLEKLLYALKQPASNLHDVAEDAIFPEAWTQIARTIEQELSAGDKKSRVLGNSLISTRTAFHHYAQRRRSAMTADAGKNLTEGMRAQAEGSKEKVTSAIQQLRDSMEEIIQRATRVRAPWNAIPAPTGATSYGTTGELFLRLQKAIAAQTSQSEQASALLAYWTIASWFPDGLTLAPGLAIIGPAYEGDLVLRTLRNFCRNSLMMTGINTTNLKNINWNIPPTLLCYAPSLTKQMASLLGCNTRRGYMVVDADYYKDHYGPKAIFLGEAVSVDRLPRCSVQVSVLPTATACATQKASRLAELEVQELQNELLGYRVKNLVRVYNSDFDASTLTSDTRAIANALGACIVDSSELQSQLISLLAPVENQREADRSTGVEAVILEATLSLYHAGKAQIFVAEIATEVNLIARARGERLQYSAETIGHGLKRVGLSTRRLGKAGKGLVMDMATMARVHELAAVYGGVGLEQDENNLHCPLCTENK
jgi:hypothetical protein